MGSTDARMTTPGRTQSPIDPAATRREAARVLGALFIAGGIFALLFLVVVQPESANKPALTATGVVAAVIGTFVLLAGARMPVWTIRAAVAAGTGMIGISFALGGNESHAFEILFVWPVVYSAFFFRRWVMGAQVALVAVVYIAALLAQPFQRDGFLAIWLFTIAGFVVAAALVSQLIQQRRELERSREHLAALVEAATDPIIGTSPAGVIES